MRFRDMACAHLSEYRQNVLRIADEGVFLHGGREYRKGHILPRECLRQNILEPYRDAFFSSQYGSIKLHKYFHHLNSSQALCINLFFPLLFEGETKSILRSMGVQLSLPVDATFEAESKLEVAVRRTSFDFHLRSSRGEQVFVEVKYTEDGFGAAKNDEDHCKKFRETYLPLLEGSQHLAAVCKDQTFFLRNYQVMRNLVHIAEKSDVVFLFPRGNKTVRLQAEYARDNFLSEAARDRLHIVMVDDVVAELKECYRGGKLDGYYQSFEQKYLGFTQ